jgi:DNA repair protein NreA
MPESNLCIQCKGRGFCGGPCKILARLKEFQPKVSLNFSGSSPPEIFVGKYNYPNVFAGILSPNEFGSTEYLSLPEAWHEQQASIQDILNYRSRMIYSRFIIKTKGQKNKFLEVMQEISLASKAVDASFELKKKPQIKIDLNAHTAMIGNPAPLKRVTIESNPKIEKKVDYLVSDNDVKANQAIHELYHAGINVSNIIKVLSAGMLGMKIQRKLVPTRWAVTATDDSLSKELLEKIRYYQEVSEILLFNANYLGNYYNILLIPGCWGFEVIEASSRGYFGQASSSIATWHDYEFYQARKKYASSVTGAYYANRLAVAEFLEKIKRQASCLVMREVREEYWAPCGVGILREVTREAMSKKPEKFSNLDDAFKKAQESFKLPVAVYKNKSVLLKENKEQIKLTKWF